MGDNSKACIGIDTSKLRNAVAIAAGGRTGEGRYQGGIDTTDAATRKPVATLAAKYGKLTFRVVRAPRTPSARRAWADRIQPLAAPIASLGHTCISVQFRRVRRPGQRQCSDN